MYKQILTLALAFSLPAVSGFCGFDGYQEDVQVKIRRNRGVAPKQPTGTKLSKELVAGIQAKPKKASSAIAADLLALENGRPVGSLDYDNLTFVAIQESNPAQAAAASDDEPTTPIETPLLVAKHGDATVWTTTGGPACFVEHIALQITEDGNLITTLCVHGTNDMPFYTFGDKTFVMPESDLDAVILFVKVDIKTGATLDMEAYPANSLKPGPDF